MGNIQSKPWSFLRLSSLLNGGHFQEATQEGDTQKGDTQKFRVPSSLPELRRQFENLGRRRWRLWKAENQRGDSYTERAQQGVPLAFSAKYWPMMWVRKLSKKMSRQYTPQSSHRARSRSCSLAWVEKNNNAWALSRVPRKYCFSIEEKSAPNVALGPPNKAKK